MVTEAEVRAIMGMTIITLPDAKITPFILTADKLITSILVGTTLSSDTLYEIEKWLSAHLIASITQRAVIEEKIGDAAVRYNASKGEGLASTPYGQAVLLLDTSGLLAKLMKLKASMYAVKSFDE